MARARPTKPSGTGGGASLLRSQSTDINRLEQQQTTTTSAPPSSNPTQSRSGSRNRNGCVSASSSLPPSPPRLRDRKSSAASTSTTSCNVQPKQETAHASASTSPILAASSTKTSNSAGAQPKASPSSSSPNPSPTKQQNTSVSSTSLPCKRPQSTGSSPCPTRVLPKRACSLLATPPQRSNHQRASSLAKSFSSQSTVAAANTVQSNSSGKQTTPNGPVIVMQQKSAQHQNKATNKTCSSASSNQQTRNQSQPCPTTSKDNDTTNKSLLKEGLQTQSASANQKTANQKNYSREPPTKPKTLTLPDQQPVADIDGQISKQIVRIELPEPQVCNGEAPRASSGIAQQSDSTKLDTIMPDEDVNLVSSTPKGPKRLGSSILAPVEATLRTTPTAVNLIATNDFNTSRNQFSCLGSSTSSSMTTTSSLNSSLNRLPPNQVILAVKEKNFNVLIGVTGSVATIKLIELIKRIQSMFPRVFMSKQDGITYQASISIRVVMTEHSKHFMPSSELKKELKNSVEVFEDADEWTSWKEIGDSVLHIELRKWADLMLIAPLDANTMAKLSNGICDNLLTCIVRAWDTSRPLIYCPAMNVYMYDHPLTKQHFCKLQSFGYLRVDCIEKRLACGDVGMGAMAAVETITEKVVESLLQPVTRVASITRPLLNQQPTYPIISTSAHYERQQTQAVGRSINQVNTNRTTICSITDNLLRQKLAQQSFKQQQRRNNDNNLAVSNNQRPGAVTSVQNLRAINQGSESEDSPPKTIQCTLPAPSIGGDEVNHFVVANNNNSSNDVQFDDNSEFNPASLLEQSMTIGDVFPIATGSNGLPSTNSNNNDHSNNISNHYSHDTTATTTLNKNHPFHLEQVGNSKKTDLSKYNTSQLIALSYNKQRDCFTCALCKHDYKNRKSMARHMKEQHVQGSIFHCKTCGVSFKRREKLIKHNRDKHPATYSTSSSSSSSHVRAATAAATSAAANIV